jgi:hypothetical protein
VSVRAPLRDVLIVVRHRFKCKTSTGGSFNTCRRLLKFPASQQQNIDWLTGTDAPTDRQRRDHRQTDSESQWLHAQTRATSRCVSMCMCNCNCMRARACVSNLRAGSQPRTHLSALLAAHFDLLGGREVRQALGKRARALDGPLLLGREVQGEVGKLFRPRAASDGNNQAGNQAGRQASAAGQSQTSTATRCVCGFHACTHDVCGQCGHLSVDCSFPLKRDSSFSWCASPKPSCRVDGHTGAFMQSRRRQHSTERAPTVSVDRPDRRRYSTHVDSH